MTKDRSQLWIYDGAYYDLTTFVGLHPGGSAILMAKGTDCTHLIDQIHPFSGPRIRRILRDHWVGDCAPGEGQRSILRGPYLKFLERVKQVLSKHGLRYRDINRLSPAGWTYLALWTAIFYGLLGLYLFGWLGWAAAPLLGIALAFHSQFIGHEALHFALTSRPGVDRLAALYASAIVGFGQFIEHTHWNHHLNTNDLERDQDLTVLLPFMRWLPHQRWRPWHVLQHVLFCLTPLVALASRIAVLSRSVKTVAGGSWLTKPEKLWYFFLWVLFLGIWHVYPFWLFGATLEALWWATVPTAVQWFIFLVLASWNHLHDGELEPLSYTRGPGEQGFFERVMATTQNVDEDGVITKYWLTGHHIQHHLLPTVNASWTHLFVEATREVCRSHGIDYRHTPGLLAMIRAQFHYLRKMGRRGRALVLLSHKIS